MAEPLCPYCLKRPADSDDHIFPQLLGGKASIRACTKCNNTFGHSFEGKASEAFGPIFYYLAKNGAWAPRDTTLWGAIKCPETGAPFDVRADGLVRKSRVEVVQEAPKRVRISAPDLKSALKIANGMQRKRGGHITEPILQKREVKFNRFEFKLHINEELRRLAVKMLIGLLAKFDEHEFFPSREVAAWLLDEPGAGSPSLPVRFLPQSLTLPVPAPSHSILFAATSELSHAVGVVRLFDLFSFSVKLENAHKRSVALMGSLDLFDRTEVFEQTDAIRLYMPSSEVPAVVFALEQIQSMQRLDKLIYSRAGKLDMKFEPSPWAARLLLGI